MGVRISIARLSVTGLYIVHGFEDLVVVNGQLWLPLEHRWRYRSVRSGGSPAMHRVGFTTRAHQAIRLSFPPDQGRRAVARLIAISMAMGLDNRTLVSTTRTLSKKYPNVLNNLFLEPMISALSNSNVHRILSMGR